MGKCVSLLILSQLLSREMAELGGGVVGGGTLAPTIDGSLFLTLDTVTVSITCDKGIRISFASLSGYESRVRLLAVLILVVRKVLLKGWNNGVGSELRSVVVFIGATFVACVENMLFSCCCCCCLGDGNGDKDSIFSWLCRHRFSIKYDCGGDTFVVACAG